MPILAGLALMIGSGGVAAAWSLLKLIALATNLCWYGRVSFDALPIVPAAHGRRTLLVPVAAASSSG